MPVRFRVTVFSQATEDLQAISEYIAIASPLNARRMRQRLADAIDALEFMPAIHPVAPEKDPKRRLLRNALVGPYRIVFAVVGREVRVYTIRHTAQRPLRRLP
ncbi:MAG: type II toxin-antitoxin system RelE/ParE family toxin [Phycisphaerales bacterium]|nr:type II toxin-antitoxin system RelE/ParE family toxin [Phycisphaerales bacterium]